LPYANLRSRASQGKNHNVLAAAVFFYQLGEKSAIVKGNERWRPVPHKMRLRF